MPDGFIFIGVPGRRTVEIRTIGAIEVGKITKEVFTIMAAGSENTLTELTAGVSYLPGSLSSRFEKKVSKGIVVGGSGVELGITPPTKVFSGEQFTIEIQYRNISSVAIDSAQLKLEYPSSFAFVSSTSASSDQSHTAWEIGQLAPGATGTVNIIGYLAGRDNENFEIKGTVLSAIGEANCQVATQSASISMQPSPLAIGIELVGTNPSSSTVGIGANLQYRLHFANHTAISLRDVILRAKLSGELFDLRSIKTDGVLRSGDNTIVWNAARVPAFSSLPANASGVLEFSVQLKPSFPITRLSSKNYTLGLHAEIESPTVPRNVAATKTLGIADYTTRVRGALLVETLGFYRDLAADITNAGNLPP